MKEAAPSVRICARDGCGHDVSTHTLMLDGHCTGRERIEPANLTATAAAGIAPPCRCTAFVFPNAPQAART